MKAFRNGCWQYSISRCSGSSTPILHSAIESCGSSTLGLNALSSKRSSVTGRRWVSLSVALLALSFSNLIAAFELGNETAALLSFSLFAIEGAAAIAIFRWAQGRRVARKVLHA